MSWRRGEGARTEAEEKALAADGETRGLNEAAGRPLLLPAPVAAPPAGPAAWMLLLLLPPPVVMAMPEERRRVPLWPSEGACTKDGRAAVRLGTVVV